MQEHRDWKNFLFITISLPIIGLAVTNYVKNNWIGYKSPEQVVAEENRERNLNARWRYHNCNNAIIEEVNRYGREIRENNPRIRYAEDIKPGTVVDMTIVMAALPRVVHDGNLIANNASDVNRMALEIAHREIAEMGCPDYIDSGFYKPAQSKVSVFPSRISGVVR